MYVLKMHRIWKSKKINEIRRIPVDITYFSGTKLFFQQTAIISWYCDCHLDYDTDVTWTPWYPATWLFVQELVQIDAKENIKVLFWWESNVQRWIPAQRDSNAETFSTLSWHHDGCKFYRTFQDDIVGTLLKRVGHITVEQHARNIRWTTFNKATKWIHLELIEVRKVIYIYHRGYCFYPVCLFVFYLYVCLFVTIFDRTILLWKTGATQTVVCRNIRVRFQSCGAVAERSPLGGADFWVSVFSCSVFLLYIYMAVRWRCGGACPRRIHRMGPTTAA